MKGDRIYLGSLYSSPELDEYEETRAALLQQEVELRKNTNYSSRLYYTLFHEINNFSFIKDIIDNIIYTSVSRDQ